MAGRAMGVAIIASVQEMGPIREQEPGERRLILERPTLARPILARRLGPLTPGRPPERLILVRRIPGPRILVRQPALRIRAPRRARRPLARPTRGPLRPEPERLAIPPVAAVAAAAAAQVTPRELGKVQGLGPQVMPRARGRALGPVVATLLMVAQGPARGPMLVRELVVPRRLALEPGQVPAQGQEPVPEPALGLAPVLGRVLARGQEPQGQEPVPERVLEPAQGLEPEQVLGQEPALGQALVPGARVNDHENLHQALTHRIDVRDRMCVAGPGAT